MSSREQKRWQHQHADNQMRQVRRQIKRNRTPKRVRQETWIPDSFDELEELYGLPQSERMVPRGEQERRKKRLAEALAALEEKETDLTKEELTMQETSGEQGIVVEVSTSMCRVDVHGQALICGMRGSLSAEETGFTNLVAVGDQVIVSRDGANRGVVEAILPRRSILTRPEVFHNGHRTRNRHLQQVIAANADQLLIVASWRDPHLWPELVDRYLITAERHNLQPIICVNKIDLAEDVAACHAELRPYLALGYRVLFASARTGVGVDELREILRDHITVLAGMSGVGKSSLLAAVQLGLVLRTAEVSDRSGEGRHTTAQVNMLRLAEGGFVVDTPGIREFGLSGLLRGELLRFYPEIAAAAAECRYSNCSHTHEPGCAVKAAVERGRVSATRLHSYQKIYGDLPDA